MAGQLLVYKLVRSRLLGFLSQGQQVVPMKVKCGTERSTNTAYDLQ